MPIDVPRSFAYEDAFDFAFATAAARASSVASDGLRVVGMTPPSWTLSPPAFTTASMIVPAFDDVRTRTSNDCDAL